MRRIIDKRLKNLEDIASRKKITIPNMVFVGALEGETDIEAINSVSTSDSQELGCYVVVRKHGNNDFTNTVYDNQLQLLSDDNTTDSNELSTSDLHVFKGACERTIRYRLSSDI